MLLLQGGTVDRAGKMEGFYEQRGLLPHEIGYVIAAGEHSWAVHLEHGFGCTPAQQQLRSQVLLNDMTINPRRWQVTANSTGDIPIPGQLNEGLPKSSKVREGPLLHLLAPYPLRVNPPPTKLHLPLITSDTERPSREQRHHLEKWGRESDPHTLGRLPGCQHKGGISELKFQHPT